MIGTPLHEVVMDYMNAQETDSPKRFQAYMSFAKRGLDLFHRQVNGALKTEKITIDTSRGTASLPSGFIKLSRLYVVDSHGMVSALSESNNIFTNTDDCGNIYTVVDGGSFGGSDNTHTRDGYNTGGYYGIGGGSAAGQYRVNYEAGRIEIPTAIGGVALIIQYIGRPEMVNEDYVVHPYLVEALEEYIHYRSLKFKPNTNLGVVDYWDNKWVMSMLQGKVDINGMNVQQTKDAMNKNFGLPPKI